MTKDEALKIALDDLMVEYDMERTPFAKRVDEIFKQALAAQQEHEPENEPFVSLASVQEPVGLIDRLTNPEDHYEFTDPKKANAVLMSLCQEAADALAAPVQEPLHDEKVWLSAHNECPEDWDSLDNKECWLKGFVSGFKTAEREYKE
jgi:hypothetical protein